MVWTAHVTTSAPITTWAAGMAWAAQIANNGHDDNDR